MIRAAQISLVLALCICGHAPADCPRGDLNGDCRVDSADLQVLAQSWLVTSDLGADLNSDAHVDLVDFALFAAQWHKTGCPIVINEILAHSHSDAPDWIELYNTGSIPVNIGGWLLSDEKGRPDKFKIPAGTVVAPFGYVLFYENTDFGNPDNPATRTPFAFSENGEALYLSSGADPLFPDYTIEEMFGASETGYSFGRYKKSTGTYNFVTMSEATPGRANAYPRVGPVVINEIMYHPVDDADAEYIELLNISVGPVTLFDFAAMEPWRLLDDSGIDFWFPSGAPVTLARGGYLLLARDAAAVRRLGVPAGVPVLEWDSGKLANQGEKLQLLKPGDVDEIGNRYWIEVDRVNYGDGSHPEEFPEGFDPWPPGADGLGDSLNRLFPSRYGNDPNNWQATIPTPGATND
jgi:hypothetical protein